MNLEEMRSILEFEAEAIRNIPVSENYNKVVDIIVEQVHNQNGKLVISGMGKAGQVGQNLATTFCSTGTPSIFLHPSEAQHGDLGILQRNDALLLITNSGKTREIIELLDLARNIYSSIPIIVITGNTDSFLANEADVCLFTGHPDEVCPLKLTPTTSITVMTVIGDLLVINTMKRINFNEKEYAKRHHGGYLGDMSRSRSV
ncbi:MAG: SIS domain-containing protein [Dysgonamonadaceae bacterium]|jgi:arabinose-5-phosphate isomerase|nr:SIS domain-containing protein [Dysgonamonadaceae bacterium]MDD3356159.1 SIS domain-containing protein [Dysgonamonadaceae bacterium]MDD3727984.1 SIS domain-containing protein [Dysgonamonadaceae bacterium]